MTQFTILDKLRNSNHDIEGLATNSQRVNLDSIRNTCDFLRPSSINCYIFRQCLQNSWCCVALECFGVPLWTMSSSSRWVQWKYWLSKLQPCENNCNVDKRICQRNSNYHVKALSAGSPHRPCDWGLSQDTSPHRGKRGGRQVGVELLRVWETLISEASWTRCCSSWVILVGERWPSCFSCPKESLACIDHLLDSTQVGPDHLLGVKGAPREDDLTLATTLARHRPHQRRPHD